AAKDAHLRTTDASSRASSTDTGPGFRGGICPNDTGPGRPYGNVTAATPLMAHGIVCSRRFSRMLTLQATSIGMRQSMRRSTVLTSMAPMFHALIRTQGALSNYKNLPICEVEPAGHGIGRSRGGLATKMHFAVDGNGRPLAIVITGGQRHDGAMLQE